MKVLIYLILVVASWIRNGDCNCQMPLQMRFIFWQCYEGRGAIQMEDGYITKDVFAGMVQEVCRKAQKGLTCLRDRNTSWGCAAADKYVMLDALSVRSGMCNGPEMSDETRLLISNFNTDIYIPEFEQMVFDLAYECHSSEFSPFTGSMVKEFQKVIKNTITQYRCMAQKADELGYPEELKYVFYVDAFGGELAGLVSPSSVGLLTSTDTNSIQ